MLTENRFPLGPTENLEEAPRLQYVLWAPYHNQQVSLNAFNIQQQSSTLTATATTMSTPLSTSGSLLLNSLANGASAANLVKPPTPAQVQASASSSTSINMNKAFTQNQAIAFVYENDIYYKPKVQGELVCRITATGRYPFLCVRVF